MLKISPIEHFRQTTSSTADMHPKGWVGVGNIVTKCPPEISPNRCDLSRNASLRVLPGREVSDITTDIRPTDRGGIVDVHPSDEFGKHSKIGSIGLEGSF